MQGYPVLLCIATCVFFYTKRRMRRRGMYRKGGFLAVWRRDSFCRKAWCCVDSCFLFYSSRWPTSCDSISSRSSSIVHVFFSQASASASAFAFAIRALRILRSEGMERTGVKVIPLFLSFFFSRGYLSQIGSDRIGSVQSGLA